MDPQDLMKKAWEFLAPQKEFQGKANEFMDKAMNHARDNGMENAQCAPILNMLEGIAKQMGYGAAFSPENRFYQIYNSFKTKQLNQVIPHAFNLAKTQGLVSIIMGLVFNGKTKPR